MRTGKTGCGVGADASEGPQLAIAVQAAEQEGSGARLARGHRVDSVALNKPFAAQGQSVVKLGRLALRKLNVNGRVVTRGHLLACTGTKLTATLLYEFHHC